MMKSREQIDLGIAKYFALGALATSAAVVALGIIAFPPKKTRTVCAIEVTMSDGNVYRPSVADTCKEAWAGFNFKSLAGREWDSVLAVAIDETR